MDRLWQPAFTQQHVTELHRETVFQGFFRLDKVQLRHQCFAGGEQTVEREIFMRDDAVAVLLFDPQEDAVVLVEQIRSGALDHPRGPWCLELVAGIVESGEQAAEVAIRESQEEAGAEIGLPRFICRYMSSPGGSREYIELFYATVDSRQLGGIHGLSEEHEDIRVHIIDAEDAFTLVKQGVIDNAATIIALQWLQLNKKTLP